METVEFKLTYYVSAMLAQGGVLRLTDDRIVFSPGTIERAVGATDTEIPFDNIKLVDVTGTITESLFIRTQEKAYRFVGGEPYKVRDIIQSAVQNYLQNKSNVSKTAALAPANAAPPSTPAQKPEPAHTLRNCAKCQKPVRPNLNFCPYCKSPHQKVCLNCFEPVEHDWKFCGCCGSDL